MKPTARKNAAVSETKEHQGLTNKAVAWLRKSNSAGGHGCQVVVSEAWSGWDGEKPDAIGWRSCVHDDGTVLVEVKVSRADFLADARKPHRANPSEGMGKWRYYLCPEGLIQPDELPPRWGLLWVTARGGLKAVAGPAAALTHHSKDRYWQSAKFADALAAHAFVQRNVEREMAILAKLLQRIPGVERFNERLREANNLNQRLIHRLEQMRCECDQLRNALTQERMRAEGVDIPSNS